MKWPEINLAPLKYAKVHQDYGGPIAKISFRDITLLGKPYVEAFAYLRDDISPRHDRDKVLYGLADGSGTSAVKASAIYAAISEALERWAWAATINGPASETLGYHLDTSTTGFAAFPGLGNSPARKRAFHEAVERWSLAAWWERKLGHRSLKLPIGFEGCEAIELDQFVPGTVTVLLWKDVKYFTAYGFASSADRNSALQRASIEFDRNLRVLEAFATDKHSKIPTRIIEKRLLFFSGTEGKAAFQERILAKISSLRSEPKLCVDLPVLGPWSKYTHVWRCLFDTSEFQDNGQINYFLF